MTHSQVQEFLDNAFCVILPLYTSTVDFKSVCDCTDYQI